MINGSYFEKNIIGEVKVMDSFENTTVVKFSMLGMIRKETVILIEGFCTQMIGYIPRIDILENIEKSTAIISITFTDSYYYSFSVNSPYIEIIELNKKLKPHWELIELSVRKDIRHMYTSFGQ